MKNDGYGTPIQLGSLGFAEGGVEFLPLSRVIERFEIDRYLGLREDVTIPPTKR